MRLLLFVEWHSLCVRGFSGIAVVAALITDETHPVTLRRKLLLVSSEMGRRFAETATQRDLRTLAVHWSSGQHR
jgi:hypothetical protein